jgi:hypothetical protein
MVALSSIQRYNCIVLPNFDENGYLPPGIYVARMAEIKRRLAYNKCRLRLFAGLMRLAKHLKSVGCNTLYLNGSFITDKAEPGDYDSVWEYEGVSNTIDPLLRNGWDLKEIKRKYLGDVFCRMPEIMGKDHVEFFQMDRDRVPKGIIRIDLRERL